MPSSLFLTVTHYQSPTRWRWLLTEGKVTYVADHEVRLDPSALEFRGFSDLPTYLSDFSESRSEGDLLDEVGAWMGAHVFGGLASALRAHPAATATPIRVVLPAEAQALVFRPFELAHLDGKAFAQRGIRFIYEVEPPTSVAQAKCGGAALRLLAIFSLPSGASPLGLRRERRELARVLRNVAETQGTAIELRVLQYGATRATLQAALEDEDGWDVVHFSGHGLAGEIVLEDARGATDRVDAAELLPLLLPARARLKLITLSCCSSAAATVAGARATVGLDPPLRASQRPEVTALPSIAQHLAAALDCAVLAMRYPVEDGFATRLVTSLFERMVGKKRVLPEALQLALNDASSDLPLSPITPVLFGARAVDLKLAPPPAPPSFALPTTGLFDFPAEPEHFVGRLVPMLDASRALAPEGAERGVLFYGMAGAGKTSCAVELAYRHERGRFTGYVWYQAPNEGDDIGAAMASFLIAFEAQLSMPDRALVANLADPEMFRRRTLPRLKGLLQTNAVLIAIDNVEGLLTSSNGWRDPLWGDVIATLLDHGGRSRAVLTSRRLPASLETHPRLVRVPVHALSFPESVVLARELPNLSKLFATREGRLLLRKALQAAQGHPKLLDLADKLAADPAALERHLCMAQTPISIAAVEGDGASARFFAVGETELRDEEFVAVLKQWAVDIGATLSAEARLALAFLCRLEEEDRAHAIVEANWKEFLELLSGVRSGKANSGPVSAEIGALATRILGMAGAGLDASIEALVMSGLVEQVEKPRSETSEPRQEKERRAYQIHPAIAQAILDRTDAAVVAAADIAVADLWLIVVSHGLANEMQGGGPAIVEFGKRAVPYLFRLKRWHDAATVLECIIHRDRTPGTIALTLPRLRNLVTATTGTEENATYAGLLAKALSLAGQATESEKGVRDLLAKFTAQGDHYLASVFAGELADLLLKSGRSEEALAVLKRKAESTRNAGLGRQVVLADEFRRLQALNEIGAHTEALSAAQSLREEVRALLDESGKQGSAVNWSVCEGLLNVGCTAAIGLKLWKVALDFNGEVVHTRERRRASEIEILRARFNDYSPLLRLGRRAEARALLHACRAAYEAAHEIVDLGRVFSALADLEDEEGQSVAAARFEEIALCYVYQTHEPAQCATSHNNMGLYLTRSRPDNMVAFAHHVAAGVIRIQIGSGELVTSIGNLVSFPLHASPPSFADVVAAVEQIEGVHFGNLFASLPKRFRDGDAAIAAVWDLVRQAEAENEENMRLIGVVPPAFATALASGNRAQVDAAFEQLPPQDQRAVMTESLLQAIAFATLNELGRSQIDEVLATLTGVGWRITGAVRRIWAGERDATALTAGLEAIDARMIKRVLEILDQASLHRVMAAMPPAIQAAAQLGGDAGNQALRAAVAALPPEEAERLIDQLRQAGLIG